MSDLGGPVHLDAAAGGPAGPVVDLAADPAAIAVAEGLACPGLAVGPETGRVGMRGVARAVSVEVYHSVAVHAETGGFRLGLRACWEVARKYAAEYVGPAAHCLPEHAEPAEHAAVLALVGGRTSVAAGGFAAGRGVPVPGGASG